MEALKKLQIPISDIEKQDRAVEILDKFNALTNNIFEDLPAEIKFGHQRYEYYRDELLKMILKEKALVL